MNIRQASNPCKKVLEVAKFAYDNETEEARNLAYVVLNLIKSAIPPLYNGPEVLGSTFVKAKLYTEVFFKNSNLHDSGNFLIALPSRFNRKLHSILLTLPAPFPDKEKKLT